jgi:putative transposase
LPGNNGEYVWIKQYKTEFSVKTMCPFKGVSRSAYYAWLERPQTAIEKDDTKLIEIIKTEFQKGRKNYGSRRLKKACEGWTDMSVAVALTG